LLIGRDGEGHWVVRDRSGRYGAWIYDRAAALRYAFFENAGRPRAIIMVPGTLKADFRRA